MVDVVEEQVESLDPLLEAGLEGLPLICRDDPGNDVEGDQPLGAGLLAIDGEGDADAAEGDVGLGPLAGDAFVRGFGKPAPVGLVVGADGAVGTVHFVEEAGLVHDGRAMRKGDNQIAGVVPGS